MTQEQLFVMERNETADDLEKGGADVGGLLIAAFPLSMRRTFMCRSGNWKDRDEIVPQEEHLRQFVQKKRRQKTQVGNMQ